MSLKPDTKVRIDIQSHPMWRVPGSPNYRISSSIVSWASLIAASFLALTLIAHLAFREGTANLMGFRQLVDVDSEGNLPTWYASALLHFTALIAWMIGDRDANDQLLWRVIAFLLFAMGVDEIASVHNTPSRLLRSVVGVQDGIFMNAWVIVGAICCILVAVSYLRFLLRQPRWLARALVVAATLYVIGAIGLEILSSKIEYDVAGFDYDGEEHYSLAFEVSAVAEEVFEYAGVITAMAFLLRRARELDARLVLCAANKGQSSLVPQESENRQTLKLR